MNPLNNLPSAVSGAIPARAGFTGADRLRRGRDPDHPRSRGVYATTPSRPWGPCGSSPLARGLHRAVADIKGDVGIIPARAGFTRPDWSGSSPRTDHPRSRGVYTRMRRNPPSTSGSSPLARGLPERRGDYLRTIGIIPARAGFTCPHAGRRRRPADHPRSRGVYRRVSSCFRFRVWIIPARAGFTLHRLRQPPGRRDHPRSRGVYQDQVDRRRRGVGSSPLARGLHGPAVLQVMAGGIIPARAGFTVGGRFALACRGDHPRSRGVYASSTGPPGIRPGSSPLARGLRANELAAWQRVRIIPARAGFTSGRYRPH